MMHYVYILESLAVPGHYYTGSTDNLRQRLSQHRADVDASRGEVSPLEAQDLPCIRAESDCGSL